MYVFAQGVAIMFVFSMFLLFYAPFAWAGARWFDRRRAAREREKELTEACLRQKTTPLGQNGREMSDRDEKLAACAFDLVRLAGCTLDEAIKAIESVMESYESVPRNLHEPIFGSLWADSPREEES